MPAPMPGQGQVAVQQLKQVLRRRQQQPRWQQQQGEDRDGSRRPGRKWRALQLHPLQHQSRARSKTAMAQQVPLLSPSPRASAQALWQAQQPKHLMRLQLPLLAVGLHGLQQRWEAPSDAPSRHRQQRQRAALPAALGGEQRQQCQGQAAPARGLQLQRCAAAAGLQRLRWREGESALW